MDYARAQVTADMQIAAFGGPAVLRRGLVDRPCTAAILQFSTAERQGSLIQWDDKRILVSGLSLEGQSPPDNELDQLVFKGVAYKIVAPPSNLAPDGETVLYWELVCRK